MQFSSQGKELMTTLKDGNTTNQTLNLRKSTGIALTQIRKYSSLGQHKEEQSSSHTPLFFVVVKKQATQEELKEILQGGNG